MSSERRVFVTGMGAVTSLGLDVPALWERIGRCESGIRRITAFDLEGYKSPNAAEVDSDALAQVMKDRSLRRLERTVDFAMVAASQALEQAGLLEDDPSPRNIAVLFGTGAGSSHGYLSSYKAYMEKGVRGVRPTTIPKLMANVVSSQVSMRFKLTGANYVIVSACSSSTAAIGAAYRMIRDGHADRVLCGGSDAMLDPATYAGWNNLGVMSKKEDPATCCRPFDAERDGCVLGEGAGALLLEAGAVAEASGHAVLGEIIGFGESSDATHITSPNPEGQARAIGDALSSAGITPADIGYINAHGTATTANDASESRAIRMALGDAASRIPVGSSKSYFGHLLGACGAVETIVALLALRDGRAPANLNLDEPDADCDICLVGAEPVALERPIALNNSFGFGGNNAVLVLTQGETS